MRAAGDNGCSMGISPGVEQESRGTQKSSRATRTAPRRPVVPNRAPGPQRNGKLNQAPKVQSLLPVFPARHGILAFEEWAGQGEWELERVLSDPDCLDFVR